MQVFPILLARCIRLQTWMLLHICVPNFCRNDELSWLIANKFKAFYLICRKWPNPAQNFCYSHSLNFHLSGSTESVGKQPTQLIAKINLSLRQKSGTHELNMFSKTLIFSHLYLWKTTKFPNYNVLLRNFPCILSKQRS